MGSDIGMANELQGKKIAFLAAEGVEQVELTEPWKAVEQAGATPELISIEDGEVQAFNHLDKADTFPVDKAVGDADPSDYDGLVLPGGVANPDFLRMDRTPSPSCAGSSSRPSRSASSATARGRSSRRTSSRPHADFLALVEDGPRERGRQLGRRGGPRRRGPAYRSRKPDDLPAFCAKLVEEFAEGRHAGAAPARAPRSGHRDSSTSTARWSTRTTTTPSPGSGRSASTGTSCRCGGSTGTSGWAATSSSPPSPARTSSAEHGDDVRAAENVLYMELIAEVEPLDGARELIEDLKSNGHPVILASSAKHEEIDHYLDAARRARRSRRLDGLGRRGADQARARPGRSRRCEKAGGGPRRRDGRRLRSGTARPRRRPACDRSACSRAASARASCARRGASKVFESVDDLRTGLTETVLRV